MQGPGADGRSHFPPIVRRTGNIGSGSCPVGHDDPNKDGHSGDSSCKERPYSSYINNIGAPNFDGSVARVAFLIDAPEDQHADL